MRLNSKGQVTIPADLRDKYGLHPGDSVRVVDEGDTLRIVRDELGDSRGRRLVEHMRGRASTDLTTDELLRLLRAE